MKKLNDIELFQKLTSQKRKKVTLLFNEDFWVKFLQLCHEDRLNPNKRITMFIFDELKHRKKLCEHNENA